LAVGLATALAVGTAAAGPPGSSASLKFTHALPNVPGKSVVAVEVSYPPAGASAPHRHAGSAFIYAYVVSGEIESQVGDNPPHTYKAGDSFYEEPGAHHRISRNASATEPARLLAVFVVDTGDQPLTTPDK
jgi:quercetin dioxygenase-like cupin family protein